MFDQTCDVRSDFNSFYFEFYLRVDVYFPKIGQDRTSLIIPKTC